MVTSKKLYLVVPILFFICLFSLLFSSSVSATQTYLIENQTWSQNLTSVSQGSIVFGDIDNDGDLDLALTGVDSSGTWQSKIYENNGTSFRKNTTWSQNLTGVGYSSHMFGDIDNDGDLDLALTGCNRGVGAVSACTSGYDLTKIYENNGTSFRENTTWSQNLTALYRSSLSLGDIDSDGDLDLVITGTSTISGWERSAKVYLNNGTSLVENKQWQQDLTGVSDSFIVLGDVDNDYDLDLILSGKDSSNNKVTKVYLNNDTAFVESNQWYQNLHAVNEGSLVLGDFDNDSDLDLSLTGCCDHHRIYENNGTSFVEIQGDTGVGGNLIRILESSQALGDYDNDGDLDLITTGREGFTTLYLYNSSALNFTGYTQDPESHIINLEWSSIAWSDFDNDTYLDILETGKHATLPSRHAITYTNNLTNNPNEKPTPPIFFTNYTTTSGDIHLGWLNGSDNETPSGGLYYNLRVGSTSGGQDIISGKYGGGEDNGYFGNMMQRKNFTLKSDRLSENTKYYWSVQTIDTGLRTSSWGSEMDFTTTGDLTPPTIILNTINNFNTSTPQLNVSFNCTVYDNLNITDVTLWGNWSTENWHANNTNSSGINNSDYLFSVNLSMYDDGYYIWGIRACDNSSLCKVSENRTFSIDTTNPEIDLILPLNDTIWNTGGTVTFSYNVTDVHISNCSLVVDGSIKETDYSIETENTLEISTSLDNGQHKWQINCTDEVNYQNSSNVNKLRVSYNPSLGGVSKASSGRRAVTEVSEEREPVKKIEIQEKHLKEIKIPEKEKPRLIRWFETVYAFIIALFMIFGYVWIVKKDFEGLKE